MVKCSKKVKLDLASEEELCLLCQIYFQVSPIPIQLINCGSTKTTLTNLILVQHLNAVSIFTIYFLQAVLILPIPITSFVGFFWFWVFFFSHIFHQWTEDTAIYNEYPQNKGRVSMIIQTETLSNILLLCISALSTHRHDFYS